MNALHAFLLWLPFLLHCVANPCLARPNGSPSPASAQDPANAGSFKNEPYVFEQLEHTARFDADGKGERTTYFRIRIQSESAVREFGLLVYPFASSFESLDVQFVRVIRPDGTVLPTPAAEIQELDTAVSREAPMYTDEREKHIPVKSLAVGDILEGRLVWTIHDPIAPGHFWLDYDFFRRGICLLETLRVDVPAGVPVTLRKSEIQPTIQEDNGRRTYLFQRSNLTKINDESKIPAWEREFRGAPPPEIGISSFSSWREIGDWYRSISQPKADASPDVKAKAEELTKGLDSEDARIRALYKYVSTSVRYIGIDLGRGRYTPHSASEVLANRYGDCKDKETLFAALLQAAGITSYPALISSHYHLDQAFPTVGVFDHVITAIPQGPLFRFLDTTPEVAPFGSLSQRIRDRQALVIPASGPSGLVTTPADNPLTNLDHFRMESSIDADGTLVGKGRLEERGDSELIMRMVYHSTPQNKWQDFTQRLVSGLGFAGSVSDVIVAEPEDTSKSFSIAFSYRRTDYPEWKQHRISLPTPPIGLAVLTEEQKLSTAPLPLGSPHELIYESTVKIPDGFTVNLPASVRKHTDFADFTAAYSFENNVLKGTFRFQNVKREIPGSDRAQYSTFASDVDDVMRKYIFVGKPAASDRKEVKIIASENSERQHASTSTPPSTSVVKDPDGPTKHEVEIQELYDAASRASNGGNNAEAARLLEQIVEKDPNHKSAWNYLGWVYNKLGKYEKAELVLRKDIELNPSDPSAYNNLGNALVGQKRYDEAVPQFLKQIEIKPGDQWSHTNLGNAYIHLQQYDKAVAELEASSTINPKDPNVFFLLARACAKAGKRDQALASYEKSINLEPTENRWNSVAYEMALDKLDMDRAQQLAEKAVANVSERISKLSLDYLSADEVRLPAALSAYWDTLGWIDFQKGNLADAEKYVQCAWRLRTIGVIGDHLGQIYQKQGRKEDAKKAYAQALVSTAPQTETKERLVAMLSPGQDVEPLIEQARSDLTKTQQVQVRNSVAAEGLAEFWLLLGTSGRLAGVKFVSGDESLRRSVVDLQATTFPDLLPTAGELRIPRRIRLICASPSAACSARFVSAEAIKSVN
jgi:tetratricopeptide (TPR) repeat protein